ncbi:MAG: HD domain-containing protein [Thermoproteota archaeon]|nr:HD domain-containing protein [Thermoproteota archaeon]
MDYFCRLKEVKRTGWVAKLNLDDSESVSDHTLSMVVLALLFAELNKYSLSKTLKIIKMILIHDLAESIIGDLTPESDMAKEKAYLENKAMKKILSEMPSVAIGNTFLRLWREYTKNETFESQFVHLIDKLDMVIQAKYYVKTNGKLSKRQINPFLISALEYSTKMNNTINNKATTTTGAAGVTTSYDKNKDSATTVSGNKERGFSHKTNFSLRKSQDRDLEYIKEILIQLCK